MRGGQKESDHRVFEETQFINYTVGRNGRSGERSALVLSAPGISPPLQTSWFLNLLLKIAFIFGASLLMSNT